TNNQWFETQDSISYWDDFYRQKIVWKRIGSILRFSFDSSGMLALDSTCFATGNSIKYLVVFLNSKLGHYLLKDAPKTGTGDLLISVQALNPILIPIPDDIYKNRLEGYLDTIIDHINKGLSYQHIEDEVNESIYSLFDFNNEEIKFLETFNY
ncbi:hypothetical protein ACG2LH_18215, partial [Zhouia sp. PK063]